MKKLFSTRDLWIELDAALLIVRLIMGPAFILHGWPLIQHPITWGAQTPIPGFFQLLAAVAEFGGGIALLLGLLTRLAATGLTITMAVAVLVHLFVFGDPFVHPTGGRSYELAAIYFAVSILLIVTGPGRFALDPKIFGKTQT